MLTGKTVRITPEDRKEKVIKAQEQRQEYINNHLGGFKQIYPLDRSSPAQATLMDVYDDLMLKEDDVAQEASKKRDKEGEK